MLFDYCCATGRSQGSYRWRRGGIGPANVDKALDAKGALPLEEAEPSEELRHLWVHWGDGECARAVRAVLVVEGDRAVVCFGCDAYEGFWAIRLGCMQFGVGYASGLGCCE